MFQVRLPIVASGRFVISFEQRVGTLQVTEPSVLGARNINGYLQTGLTSGLPSTAAPVQNTSPYIPIFGFTTIASP